MLDPHHEFSDEIYSLVEKVENVYKTEAIERHKKYEKIFENLNEQIGNAKLELQLMNEELMRKEANLKNEQLTMKLLHIVRQYINVLFNKKWDVYNKHNSTQDVNFQELVLKTDALRRKDILNKENNGVKYALLVINGICNDISVELATFYMQLNDKYRWSGAPMIQSSALNHPKIKPIYKHAAKSIEELEQIISKTQSNIVYDDMTISQQLLHELKSNLVNV